MATSNDPRRPGGHVAGPGGPNDRNGVVVDTTDAVILDYTGVVLVEPYRVGKAGPPILGLTMAGRINKTDDRADILYLMDEDGAAALVVELIGLASRMGPEFSARFSERLDAVLAAGRGDV